jgi:CHAD domain-containing protein
MSFEIKRKESVLKAVRRIGRKRAKKVQSALRHCETMEAIHETRKDVKQLRAMLRLARSGLRRSEYCKLMSKLKQSAGMLAGPRDAFVKTTALDSLKSHYKHELAAHPFRAISQMLSNECRKSRKGLSKKLKASGRAFKSICKDFDRLDLDGSGWRLLGPGVKRTYRDGRRAWRMAQQTGKSEHFHEWRKRAKDLYYQVRLLCRIWREQMDAMESELKQLGDFLGDAHDLFLLAGPEGAKELPKAPKEETGALIALAQKRQKELQMRALALGAKLYAEKPAFFCKRLKHYWQRWRKKSNGVAST